ncbi:MAG TPA: hypothetical protein VIG50_00540 [Vicinamibacteria bacterium]
MTTRLTTAGVLLVTAVAGGLACRRGEAPAPAASPAAPSPSAAAAPAEAVRQVVVRSLAFGKSINPDGTVAAPTETFTAGEPLFVSLDVQPISPGTEVRLTWRGPAGQDEGEEELVVPAGARVINFKARDTSAWPSGEHRLEVTLGGAPAGAKPFRIAGGPSASPSTAGASR